MQTKLKTRSLESIRITTSSTLCTPRVRILYSRVTECIRTVLRTKKVSFLRDAVWFYFSREIKKKKKNFIEHGFFSPRAMIIITIIIFYFSHSFTASVSLNLSLSQYLSLSRTLPTGESESLSNVLHQWANRFKTIMPRNRKLKMTVADIKALRSP